METTETSKSTAEVYRPTQEVSRGGNKSPVGAMWRDYIAFILALALATTVPSVIEVQAADRVVHIGVLRPGSPPDPLVETFRQALRELGYVEGRNLRLELRWAEGRDE